MTRKIRRDSRLQAADAPISPPTRIFLVRELRKEGLKSRAKWSENVKCIKGRRNFRDSWPNTRALFSSQPSPPPRSRRNVTGVPSGKSTTTRFNSCTMHVWKRSPALWRKLCPPALCDKNQVPSMFFFFLFHRIGHRKGIVVVVEGGGMCQKQGPRLRGNPPLTATRQHNTGKLEEKGWG